MTSERTIEKGDLWEQEERKEERSRRFPIHSHDHKRWPRKDKSVPWGFVAPHEEQAKRNHGGQTLERLAERGGLSTGELLAVIEGRPCPYRDTTLVELERLVRLFEEWESRESRLVTVFPGLVIDPTEDAPMAVAEFGVISGVERMEFYEDADGVVFDCEIQIQQWEEFPPLMSDEKAAELVLLIDELIGSAKGLVEARSGGWECDLHEKEVDDARAALVVAIVEAVRR